MGLYSFLLTVVLVAGAPYWLVRMALSGRYREGLAGRLGFLPGEFRDGVAALRGNGGVRPLMWIHAVSVGEVLAAARLVEEFRSGEFERARPGMVYAVSTTTQAGQRLARKRLPECAVFYFPLDFGFAVRRYLRLLAPEMMVLMESELWPRLITECFERKIPLVVANARISDRSFPRYMRLRALWGPLLGKVAVFLAQSGETVERLRRIGAPRVELTGNLKYDARPAQETAIVRAVRRGLAVDSPIVVCGSTLEGEEAMVLDAWQAVLRVVPRAVLVLAPRHTPRFDGVAALVEERGLLLVRASSFMRNEVAIERGSVFLLDTIGDLAAMYGLAAVAFVGGSLVNAGGHNPLEPAQFGVPVLLGPSVENFREIVDAMRMNDGVRRVTRETLAEAVIEMLQDRGDGAGDGGAGPGGRDGAGRSGGADGDGVAEAAAASDRRAWRAAVKRPVARRWLLPLVPVYAAVIGAKNWLVDRGVLPQRGLGHPVISVGSISAGGAGKTPVVILLAELLQQRGYEVRILTRGYRRNGVGILRVDPEGDAREFGDEPLLMARRLKQAAVWVAADRHRAGLAAARGDLPGAKVVYLLDDGFQHRKLAREVDIVLVTGQDLEDRLLPAGNLREPLRALKRADVIVERGDEAVAAGIGTGSRWVIRRRLEWPTGVVLPSRPVGFCGLARPESFFSMLAAEGVVPVGTSIFRDHHAYSDRDIEGLIAIARAGQADGFLTTEKDAVKLSAAMLERLAGVGPVVAPELRVELIDEQMRVDDLVSLLV